MAEELEEPGLEGLRLIAEGQPYGRCGWSPCWEGCCLTSDGLEKFNQPVLWLRYLITHLLEPGAIASEADHPLLKAFSYDHMLSGTVVGCRRADKELFRIDVVANEVSVEILKPGDPRVIGYPPLAYELENDIYEEQRTERRRAVIASRRRE